MSKLVTLTLIRGIPGSGKSTLAKQISKATGAKHIETDMYCYVDGKYCFDPKLHTERHNLARYDVVKNLNAGESVVVSNTFIKKWEVEKYTQLSIPAVDRGDVLLQINILTCIGEYKNIHNVPEQVIQRMKDTFELI